MSKIARVILDSPLPSLDKLFDYEIPEKMRNEIVVGSRVRVPFGRTKKTQDAFVIELAETTDFVGKLSEVSELVSAVCVLPTNIYSLIRSVANRQASTVGDILASALVARSVRVEKSFVEKALPLQQAQHVANPQLSAHLARPTQAFSEFSKIPIADWVAKLLTAAKRTTESGFSAILLVPDFRDQALIREVIQKSELKDLYVDFTGEQPGSKRYAAFLNCLVAGTHIVVGSRSALYAPLQNLGLIAIFDDGDSNFQDQQSPYANARDIALLRQIEDRCSLLFVGHSRSSELQRLVDMKYVTELPSLFSGPRVAYDETVSRVSTLAWQAIREAAETGVVLVQVASKGVARTAYCQDCAKRAVCSRCSGPIWIDAKSTPRCRWCNAQNLAFSCSECKGSKLRQGYGGSTRTVAEFGAAFAGLQLIESTGEKPLLTVEGKGKIVISTPGAEPDALGGYSAVVILDAKQSLLRDSLRASEEAVRQWSNAIAKLSPEGRAVVVGIPAILGQRLSLWQQIEIARDELENRRELNFPPHVRLGSIEGPAEAIAEITSEIRMNDVQVLGPITVRSKTGGQQQRIVLKYPYSAGALLSSSLMAAQLKISAGMTKTSATGRVSRAVRLRMDDPEVI